MTRAARREANASAVNLSAGPWLYVPRAKVVIDLRGNLMDGPTAPNPIFPVSNPAWLYVPRAHIVVPVGPAAETFYYLNENGVDRFLSEDGLNLFIQEG